MIEIQNITKTYLDGNKEKQVLKKTDLTFDKGSFVAIIGPSGSGKSTLLTIIGALQKPTTGTLKIDGRNVYDLDENERSDLRFASLGFVLQASNLIPYLTIREQFELKLKQAKKPMDAAEITALFKTLSIDTIQNKYPESVSGGERQRAAIGLALILNPPILLTDEPTASLDTERAIQVVELLKDISRKQQTIVIMVTHDQRMLSYCDRVIQIEDGVVTEK